MHAGSSGATIVQRSVVRRPDATRRLQPTRWTHWCFSASETVSPQVRREVAHTESVMSTLSCLDRSRRDVLAALGPSRQLRGGRAGCPTVTARPSRASPLPSLLFMAAGDAVRPGSQSDHPAAALALQPLGETATGGRWPEGRRSAAVEVESTPGAWASTRGPSDSDQVRRRQRGRRHELAMSLEKSTVRRDNCLLLFLLMSAGKTETRLARTWAFGWLWDYPCTFFDGCSIGRSMHRAVNLD